MKRILLCAALLLLSLAGLRAQSFTLVFADEIPASAVSVLQLRMVQMLQAGGFSVAGAEESGATPLRVNARVVKRLEMAGGQVALELELIPTAGAVSEVFPLKGVGGGDEDAWVRAVKQFLPRSKNAQNFVQKLKQ